MRLALGYSFVKQNEYRSASCIANRNRTGRSVNLLNAVLPFQRTVRAISSPMISRQSASAKPGQRVPVDVLQFDADSARRAGRAIQLQGVAREAQRPGEQFAAGKGGVDRGKAVQP